MAKKILVVVESLLVEESSGAKANLALIENLSKAGFDLRIYHYSRKEVSIEGIQSIAINENRTSFLFFLSRFERYLRKAFNIRLNKLIDEVLGFSFTLFNDRNSIVKSLNRLEDFNPDLVLTLSQGASFRPHHALLKIPKWHHKWMAYIHDPYPMHSYPRPYDWVEPGHQKKRNFFLQVAEKAKYAAFPSLLLAEWMQGYYLQLKSKSIVIPHQINSDWKPLDSEKKDSLEITVNKFSILHSGNFLNFRNPFPLVEAFQGFLKKHPEANENCTLIFCGPDSTFHPSLYSLEKKVPQLRIMGNLGFSKSLQLMNSVNVNVILEAESFHSPFLPGKFPLCVQAGKPILLLSPEKSESKRLLGENYPYWAEPYDSGKMESFIEHLYLEWRNSENLNYGYKEDLKYYLGPEYLKEKIENSLNEFTV